jgi:hypothetical protein
MILFFPIRCLLSTSMPLSRIFMGSALLSIPSVMLRHDRSCHFEEETPRESITTTTQEQGFRNSFPSALEIAAQMDEISDWTWLVCLVYFPRLKIAVQNPIISVTLSMIRAIGQIQPGQRKRKDASQPRKPPDPSSALKVAVQSPNALLVPSHFNFNQTTQCTTRSKT